MLEAGATPASLAAGEIVPPVAPEAIENTPEAHSAANAIRRAHPLYSSITLMLLTEIINSRLFTTVRDALGICPLVFLLYVTTRCTALTGKIDRCVWLSN
jgi:hypothetical protein